MFCSLFAINSTDGSCLSSTCSETCVQRALCGPGSALGTSCLVSSRRPTVPSLTSSCDAHVSLHPSLSSSRLSTSYSHHCTSQARNDTILISLARADCHHLPLASHGAHGACSVLRPSYTRYCPLRPSRRFPQIISLLHLHTSALFDCLLPLRFRCTPVLGTITRRRTCSRRASLSRTVI